jgi:hypothetical protein
VIFVTIDPFKRALVITAISFNQTNGSIFVSGLTPEAASILQHALQTEPHVGGNIKKFSWTDEYQGMTTLAIYLLDDLRGERFHELPSLNLSLGECLGMYLDVDSFTDTWKDYVKRLMTMGTE